MQEVEFTRGQIRAIECAKEAWALIKDEYWTLVAISIVGALIGGISMYVLIGAMICGIFYSYLKKIDSGKASTPFLRFGDRVRIEMFDIDGNSIFGAIDQEVVRYAGAGRP